MVNPLNDMMLDAMVKESSKKISSLGDELKEAVEGLMNNDGERMAAMQIESIILLLKEHQVLKEAISVAFNIVTTTLSDMEETVPKHLRKGNKMLQRVRDFREQFDRMSPHTDLLVKRLLPELEKAIKEN